MHRPLSKTPQPPAIPQRKRAKRGQATDPHSIAERVSSTLASILNTCRLKSIFRDLSALLPNIAKTL